MKPGPVPMRSEERVRRNKDNTPVDRFDVDGDVEIPTAFFFNKVINNLWLSLKQSVNVRYFEPSDWQYAILAFTLWDEELGHDAEGNSLRNPGPTMLMALDAMLSKLLITEGERRRLRIEVDRNNSKTDDQGTVLNASDRFRERFEQQREA